MLISLNLFFSSPLFSGSWHSVIKDSGTGLGLAVCYSIANRHNAYMKVETGPGGTTFSVRFTQDRLEQIIPANTTSASHKTGTNMTRKKQKCN